MAAKQLASVLPTKTQANFLTFMDSEVAAGKCVKNVVGTMTKYEYPAPDGTLVRYKTDPDGFRPPPTYSIEVKHRGQQPVHRRQSR
jgi:hypothetical protein